MTLLALPVATLALLIAACGSSDEVTTPPAGSPDVPGDADPLADRTFLGTAIEVGTAVGDGDAETVPVPGDGTFEVSFGAGDASMSGSVSARADCNHLGGGYTIEGDRLIVGDMSTTEMGCDPERHEFDELLAALLASPTFELSEDTLVLTTTTEDRTLRAELVDAEVADPAPPFEGTTWRLDGIVDGDAVSSVPAPVGEVTMTAADGFLSIDTGCNGVGGDYTFTDGTIEVAPGPSTQMFCGEEVNALEEDLRLRLDGTLEVVQERGSLVLTGSDGRGLVFVSAV